MPQITHLTTGKAKLIAVEVPEEKTGCVKSLYFDGSKYYYNDCEGAKEEVDIVPCYILVTMGAVVSRISGYRLKFRTRVPAISFDEDYKEPVVYLLSDKKPIPEWMIVWMHKDK